MRGCPTPISQVAQSLTVEEAALAYARLGFSVLPLKGKRPSLAAWRRYQTQAASTSLIHIWIRDQLFQNVGLVCGAVSGNLVVLDVDGLAGYERLCATFPSLTETYTVATGSGEGYHVYWRVDGLPASIRVMNTDVGHLELRVNGCQIVAPPSVHPLTQRPYIVAKEREIRRVANLTNLVQWLMSFKSRVARNPDRPLKVSSGTPGSLNPHLIQALIQHFMQQHFRCYGTWLHGSCIYPHRHKHQDLHPSFGFHTISGYGHCFVCGTILAKDICRTIGLDPRSVGGLMRRSI